MKNIRKPALIMKICHKGKDNTVTERSKIIMY